MANKVKLDIPESAFKIKANWPKEPDRLTVQEILQWIRDGNQSYLWRGHTHTKPKENSKIVFVGEFCLPESLADDGNNWYPCPCCHWDIPWFKGKEERPGMIAWFPEEHVIRLIGHDCFTKLNPEGYRIAKENWKKQKKLHGNIYYISQNFHLIPRFETAIQKNLAIAKALDHFYRLFHLKIKSLNLHAAVKEISSGDLMLNVENVTLVKQADGSETFQNTPSREKYSSFDGKEMLEKGRKPIEPKLHEALSLLESAKTRLEALNGDTSIENYSEVKNIVSAFSRAVRISEEAMKDVQALKKFLGPITLNTIYAWGAHKQVPANLYFSRENNKFFIGTEKSKSVSIQISTKLEEPITRLPQISPKENQLYNQVVNQN